MRPGERATLDDDVVRQFAALGVPADHLPPPVPPPADLEILPQAWPTVRLFLAAQTQWMPANGGVMGLIYSEVRGLADDLDLKPVRWADLQVMEIEARHILNGGDA